MAASPAMIKELRERTAAGMLDCKKALEETNGNMEEAIDYLRKKGIAKAAKKAGRIAAEGLVFVAVSADGKTGAMVEFNSETDFVAKNAVIEGRQGEAYAAIAEQKAAEEANTNVEDSEEVAEETEE